jgi:copper chaperone CopZ
MTHHYNISGLTCDGCVAKVKQLLSQIVGIQSVDINAERTEASIQMAQHISTADLKAALKDYPKYQIEDKIKIFERAPISADDGAPEKTWLETYKPILLIFAYILGVTVSISDNFMDWMRYFMAGFFLVFSFFKLLNLRGFADSYQMYDIVAKAIPAYSFVYPFIELGLGVAYLIDFQPIATNWITFVVMSVSLIGVLQSVFNKRKIQCACLGAVFELPMSTVTIIEDLLMIVMAALMLALMYFN